MISVYYDKDGLYDGRKDAQIHDFKEYVDAYIGIHDAIHKGMDLTVVTDNKQIFRQLEQLKDFYPRRIVSQRFSLREDLESKLHTEIPGYISEQDLTSDKGYLSADFGTGDGFENAILRHYLDNYFIGDDFPFASLASLSRNLSLEAVTDKKNIVLRKVFQRRIRNFAERVTGKYEKLIIDEFIQDFDALRSDVGTYLLIKNYPEGFREDILGHDMCRCLDHFNLSGDPFELPDDVEKNVEDRAKVYLNQPAISFGEALSCVTGARRFEFDLLLAKKDSYTEEDVHALRDKFSGLLHQDSEAERKIMLLRAPVDLKVPSANKFNTEDWIQWARENYLPYKFWLEITGKYDPDADKYSSEFGDWFFKQYDSLVNGYPYMMYKIIPLLKNDFISNQHSLVVMLDNFNYKFVPELKRYEADAGFNLLSDNPVFAMIPTETAISKRAFFTGEAYNDNGIGYDKLTAKWAEQMEISMRYLPHVGALREMTSFDEKVVFLNYLRIDEMLHEDQSDSAQPLEERIRQELNALLRTINSTLKRLGRDKDTDIYFIADHGSTRILPEQPNEIDPKFFKDRAAESDYRFIAVSDEDFEKTKSAIGSLCYALDKNRFGTKQHFFIARNYNRFIKSELKAYVHGGITPEETIVPLLHFAFDVEQCRDPEVTLGNDTLRFSSKVKLILVLKNFNEFELTDIDIEILNRNVKYEKPEKAYVDGSSSCMIELPDSRITKALDKELNEKMTIKVTYKANGKTHTFMTDVHLPMKSMQSSASDLSDLF